MSQPNPADLKKLVKKWQEEAAAMRDTIAGCEGKIPETIYNGLFGVLDSRASIYEECAEALNNLME